MASTLPTSIAVSTTGHPGLHNAVNAAVNEHDGRIASLEGRATALEGVATIVGAGRPDVAASMTTDVQAQVRAAPVGSTFASTDGASVGAWLWVKESWGWICTYISTPRMYLTGALNGWKWAEVQLSRANDTVSMRVHRLDSSNATSNVFFHIPDGFKPYYQYTQKPVCGVDGGGTSPNMTFVYTNGDVLISGVNVPSNVIIGTTYANECSWQTGDSIPLALPS